MKISSFSDKRGNISFFGVYFPFEISKITRCFCYEVSYNFIFICLFVCVEFIVPLDFFHSFGDVSYTFSNRMVPDKHLYTLKLYQIQLRAHWCVIFESKKLFLIYITCERKEGDYSQTIGGNSQTILKGRSS